MALKIFYAIVRMLLNPDISSTFLPRLIHLWVFIYQPWNLPFFCQSAVPWDRRWILREHLKKLRLHPFFDAHSKSPIETRGLCLCPRAPRHQPDIAAAIHLYHIHFLFLCFYRYLYYDKNNPKPCQTCLDHIVPVSGYAFLRISSGYHVDLVCRNQ